MESEGGGVQLPLGVLGEAAGNGSEVGQTVSLDPSKALRAAKRHFNFL